MLLTGPVLPKTLVTKLDEKWTNWLCNFEQGVVELLLGFELCGQPFLVALSTLDGSATIEEALPEGSEERVKGRGWVYRGWVPQKLILEHPSIGCFVTHYGYGSMWESLLNDYQIVCVPHIFDQIVNARFMVEELKHNHAKLKENDLKKQMIMIECNELKFCNGKWLRGDDGSLRVFHRYCLQHVASNFNTHFDDLTLKALALKAGYKISGHTLRNFNHETGVYQVVTSYNDHRGGGGNHNHEVHVFARTCDYGKWQNIKIPCSHAIKVLQGLHLDVTSYIDPCYSLDNTIHTYAHQFVVSKSESLWRDVRGPRWVPDPQLL
ncbi:udp-glycosyltransferase 79b3 [Quercus suber]|uniref:Udp-glycosyltransferase 79b3 n=1 Tax=Quercus suber TaxID=58331 RepID=A0AAW0LX80_QUESU